MMSQTNLEDRIWNLKKEIHETRAYLSSDCCTQCSKMYAKLYNLEQELNDLVKLENTFKD